MKISVIIPTYKPQPDRLNQTLDGLKRQNIKATEWELIIVDNNSPESFADKIDISWHPAATLIKEQRQGLTYARLKGFAAAKGELIILVDDDNILEEDYLGQVARIFAAHGHLGAIGGKSVPLFEAEPPAWLPEFYGSLALRDLGDEAISAAWTGTYPACAPIGAGMAIRKGALKAYLAKAASGEHLTADRTGASLSSGGDNEIVLEALKSGWQVAYFPELSLQHIIPAGRTGTGYLARLLHDTNRSWVLLLARHGIYPWPGVRRSTLVLRKMKAYFNHKAWRGHVNYIRWRGACGMFEGLADII